MLPRRFRAVERAGAKRTVETRHVAAGHGRPDHAVAVDVHAPRREAFDRVAIGVERRLEDFRQRGGGRVVSGYEPHYGAGITEGGTPYRAVGRRRHAVVTTVDAHVARRVRGFARFGVVRVAHAVAVGVEDERRPALGRHGIAGFKKFPGIEPADDAAAAAGPQGMVLVFGEHQVVRAETGIDRGIDIGPGIVNPEMAAGAAGRKHLGGRMLGTFLAEFQARCPAPAPGR